MTNMITPRLPALPALLDRDALRARLESIVDARGVLVGVTPFYLRWKQGTSALLGVRLSWQVSDGVVETLASLYLGEALGEAADKAETLRLLQPALGPALARLDDALYLAFPNDRLLKGLSAVADARRVGNRLATADASFAWRGLRVKTRGSRVLPVRWKPGRRAVLELDMKLVDDATGRRQPWRAFARVLPADELGTCLGRWRAAAAIRELAAPAVEFVDQERGWFATSVAPGRSLDAAPGSGVRLALRHALGALHSTAAPTLSLRDEREDLAAAVRALAALAEVAPELGARARSLSTGLHDRLASLDPVAHVFTHGDLGADQLLVEGDRVSVIDWDEAANGDPHADWASLLADLRARGLALDWVEPLAREVLGARFDVKRFHWQAAAAEARRAIEALQRGRADWRARSLDALAAAELMLATGPATAAPSRPRAALAMLLDPKRRFDVPGVDANASRVGAVWPEGDTGSAIVRLEHAGTPGPVVRWLRLGDQIDQVECFDFPRDPALPALARLLADGRFVAAGHRFGKRAALREVGGTRYLFLRAGQAAEKAYARVTEAHARLEAAGVTSSRPLEVAPEFGGWWAEAIAGRTLDPAREPMSVWRELGAMLAHVHRMDTTAPARDGLDAAIAAGRRQVSLVRLADPAFAVELDRDLNELPTGDTTGRPAWIHGDLHPLQVIVGPRVVILDWERARTGEAEEDLGNFRAHLAWEAPDAAPAAWNAFSEAYAAAGGAWSAPRVAAHARAAMVRVRAIHGWRDEARERARDRERWQAWGRGLSS
jgi:thiamine kinase-like enzyme